jgi:hypothetical protein
MIVKTVFTAMLALMLSACADDQKFSPAQMQPSDILYDQIEVPSFQKNQWTVDSFIMTDDSGWIPAERETLRNLAHDFDLAVAQALQKAGYLAPEATQAKYRVSGEIMDFELPNCLYGSCDGGTTIKYRVENTKGALLFEEIAVVPYTKEADFALEHNIDVIYPHAAAMLGENIAHFIQFISRKNTSDFE